MIIYLSLENITNGFLSNLHFFEDLRIIGEKIVKFNEKEKLIKLKQHLNEINNHLPACLYIPFIKGIYNLH